MENPIEIDETLLDSYAQIDPEPPLHWLEGPGPYGHVDDLEMLEHVAWHERRWLWLLARVVKKDEHRKGLPNVSTTYTHMPTLNNN